MSLNQKFADMNEAQRGKWLAWANSHDWGAAAPAEYVAIKGEMYLRTTCGVYDCERGDWSTEDQFSKTPRELREWAGY
jgi:hypothetical protein